MRMPDDDEEVITTVGGSRDDLRSRRDLLFWSRIRIASPNQVGNQEDAKLVETRISDSFDLFELTTDCSDSDHKVSDPVFIES